jgi:hypothetical protein
LFVTLVFVESLLKTQEQNAGRRNPESRKELEGRSSKKEKGYVPVVGGACGPHSHFCPPPPPPACLPLIAAMLWYGTRKKIVIDRKIIIQ